MSGISIWQLVIVFLILLLIFGTKKIKSLGGDLGNSIKSFKDAMKEDDKQISKNDSNIQNVENNGSNTTNSQGS